MEFSRNIPLLLLSTGSPTQVRIAKSSGGHRTDALEEHKRGRRKWGRHFFRFTESEGPLKEAFIKQVWAG